MKRRLAHVLFLSALLLPAAARPQAEPPAAATDTAPLIVKKRPAIPPSSSMMSSTAKRSAPKVDGTSFELDLDRLEFETLQLSYTQSDRVLGLLKALGYSTVEFVTMLGENDYNSVYEPLLTGEAKLPLVVKLIEASKTSVMEEDPADALGPPRPMMPTMPSQGFKSVPDIGGAHLHQATTGEALQRLLVVYDPTDPGSLDRLKKLVLTEVDVPGRQIVIEALVIEIDSDRLRDLGVTFSWTDDDVGASFSRGANGQQQPFTFSFDKYPLSSITELRANLHALVSKGSAEILSNPSVLVLDGRQARIQVGQQIPVVTSTATTTAVSQRVEYFPVGIVLNLRPRLAEESGEVTMQVETIVSSVNLAASAATGNDVFFAPVVDNRQVQTFVRVADNTPFIIGGLIAHEQTESMDGVPGLSRIPGLGALFRRKTKSGTKQEVIIVLTPHVVPRDDRSFGFAVPRESPMFDSFGNELFRNAYRLRNQDVFDLSFLHRNPDLVRLRAAIEARPGAAEQESLAAILGGRIPGEEVFVRRMLWETIGEQGLDRLISPERMIVFEPRAAGGYSVTSLAELFNRGGTKRKGREALSLRFERQADGTSFAQPSWEPLASDNYEERLLAGNPASGDVSTIVLGELPASPRQPLDALRRVLALEIVLELNPSLPLRLDEIYAGRQVVFPDQDDLARSYHLIDEETARLFFEVEEYYAAFERRFDAGMAAAYTVLEKEVLEKEVLE